MSNRSVLSGVRTKPFDLAPISAVILGSLVRVIDLTVLAALGLAIYFGYVHSDDPMTFPLYLITILVGLLITGVLFQWMGVYQDDYLFTRWLNTERALTAWAVAGCALLAVAFTLKISDSYSRVWALSWYLLGFLALAMLRAILADWIGRLARDGRFAQRTVILGAGEHGHRLVRHLNAGGDPRTRIIGFVDDRTDRSPAALESIPVLGNTQHLVELIRQDSVDQVIIALPWGAEGRVQSLVRKFALTPVTLRLAPDMVGFGFHDRTYAQVAGLPMLHVLERPISDWSYVAKRIEDISLATLALVFMLPLLLVIAIAVKIDSPGPVLFSQRRMGFNGKTIWVRKFRTMYAHLTDHDATVQTTRHDARVTRLGHFLRQSSLDELPQLLNVLKGDMSLVGPRPHALNTTAAGYHLEEAVDTYAARHRVKPGITGLAQINGWRGELDSVEKVQKRVEYDLAYIEEWSVWLDLKIIAKTFLLILRDDHAF